MLHGLEDEVRKAGSGDTARVSVMHGSESPAAIPDYGERGSYRFEAREISVPRRGADGDFGAQLFRPLQAQGDGAEPLAASPVFAFGHGYLAPIELYESTLAHLASWGITVVAPRSGGGPLPSHERFAADLVAALDHVADVAASDGGGALPVEAGARAVGGHSMGGGAAVLAAAMDPSIRTAATLNAADTRPSSAAAAREVTAPLLLVAASEDRIAPVDQHQRPIYEAAAGPAQLRIVKGGGHCGFLDRADLIGIVCGRPSLDAEVQRTIGRVALTAWLRAETLGDPAAREHAWRADPAGRVTLEARGREPA
jgi:pimeloyl-ACP methyl ester carboxylesterase